MENYKDKIQTYLTRMNKDRFRVEFYVNDAEYLALYYELAKKTFINKPVGMNSWTCVEAKYNDGDIYALFPSLTPRMLMEWGQELVTAAALNKEHGPQDNEG